MVVNAYDIISLIFMHPLASLSVFLVVSFVVRFLLGIFVSLPEKPVPLWFYACKSLMAFMICVGISGLFLDMTIFRADPKENPLANIKNKEVLTPCSQYVIVRKNEDATFGVPVIAQYELRKCLNLRQGEVTIGKPLAENLLDSSKTDSFTPWMINLIDSIEFKREAGFFPTPLFKKASAN